MGNQSYLSARLLFLFAIHVIKYYFCFTQKTVITYNSNLAMSNSFKQIVEAIVGKASSDNCGRQFGVSGFFPERLVHCEWYDKSRHVELHLEGKDPSPAICSLAEYLKNHLPSDDKLEIVDRHSFSFFSYMLKGPAIEVSDAEAMGHAFRALLDLVTPVVNEFINSLNETVSIAKSLSDYYNLLKKNEPYHINVIDELHANENAHSRILISLLKYPNEHRLPILDSFLSLLDGWEKSGIAIDHPSIEFNSENIDGLVEEAGKYAVIIENKIHWAVDQDSQLERYVDTVLAHGVPANHIWVVYLTSDGNKVVADYSYTDRVKALIGKRFIELNYRNDILPWLKEIILPNCTIKEEWLVTALKQYIDHLEGMFQLRGSQASIQMQMEQKLFGEIGLSRSSDLKKTYGILSKTEGDLSVLMNVISNTKASIEESLVREFEDLTQTYFAQRYPQENFQFVDSTKNGYYQIMPYSIAPNVHLELNPLRRSQFIDAQSLTIVLHVEHWSSVDRKVTDAVISGLKKDEELRVLNAKYHFKPKSQTFFSLTCHMDKPFVEMTSSERVRMLSSFYDKACLVVPIINKYIVAEG